MHVAGNTNDIFELDLVSLTWTNLTQFVTGNAPSPRCNHGFAPANGKLYVFGGGDSNLRKSGSNLFISNALNLCSSAIEMIKYSILLSNTSM